MICTHCGTKLTCGCQKATASNGVLVHKSCKEIYEAKLKTISNGNNNTRTTG